MGVGVWPFVRDDDGGASANGRVMRDKHINDVYPGPSCWPSRPHRPTHTHWAYNGWKRRRCAIDTHAVLTKYTGREKVDGVGVGRKFY